LKFTTTGFVKVVVRIIEDETSGDNELEISVVDSGIGISEEDQSKLFKLFGFIESSGHMNKKGIGLGLNIAS
jgi:signal transduction histidine kinase